MNYHVPWLKVPEILLHLKRGVFEYGLWRFSIPYGLLYVTEHAKWNTDYTPPGGLRGKRVLDVGAGCGESAMWFLSQGAHRVHAVENNREALRFLRENAWRVKGLSVSSHNGFDAEFHMGNSEAFDLVKMDIEGYEILFADYLDAHTEFNVDCVVEVHSVYQKDRFLRLGFSERVDPIFGGDPPWGLYSSARLMYRWKK